MRSHVLLVALLSACGSTEDPAEGDADTIADAGVADGAPVDSFLTDARAPDAGSDGNVADGTVPDASVDGGVADSGPIDAGTPPMCSDGALNGLELMVDCGGPDCEACEAPPPISAGALYVDPESGNDASDGSQAQPWETLAHAFAQLSAGDELVLRGGQHRAVSLSLDVDGTADAPVMIRGMPGEDAVLDASLPQFAVEDNDAWELVDASTGLYRSTSTVPEAGYVGRFYEGGVAYNLVPYTEGEGNGMANISATNEAVSTEARYVGPGFHHEGGRLFVRLAPLGAAALNGESFGLPSQQDPNQIALFIGDENPMIALSGSYIRIQDLSFHHGRFGIRASGAANNIRLSQLVFETPAIAVLFDEGVNEVLCDRLRVQGGIAPWVAWTDMKGSDGQLRPASHWSIRSVAVTGGGISNVEVRESLFERVWDGHVMSGRNIHVHHNRYDQVYDDTIQLGSSSENVEIDHNIILGAGPSHNGNGDSAQPGTVYIHDNVIDSAAVRFLWGKQDPGGILRAAYSGWHTHVAFPTHTASQIGDGNPWKIYYNTVLFHGADHPRGCGADQWTDANSTGVPHEVYNNVFIDTSGGPLLGRCSVSGGTSDNYQIYDGNVYHRAVASDAPLFVDFGGEDYDSLADFIASPEFEASRVMSPNGWEASGVQDDPDLNAQYVPASGGPAASGAIAMPVSFPGERHDYRGAIAP